MSVIEVGLIVALVGTAAATVTAAIQWTLAGVNRLPGTTWGKALFGRGPLTERGRRHRRWGLLFVRLALGLWLIAAVLSVLNLCCPPPPGVP